MEDPTSSGASADPRSRPGRSLGAGARTASERSVLSVGRSAAGPFPVAVAVARPDVDLGSLARKICESSRAEQPFRPLQPTECRPARWSGQMQRLEASTDMPLAHLRHRRVIRRHQSFCMLVQKPSRWSARGRSLNNVLGVATGAQSAMSWPDMARYKVCWLYQDRAQHKRQRNGGATGLRVA